MRARHMLMPRKDSALWVKHVSRLHTADAVQLFAYQNNGFLFHRQMQPC